LDIKDTIKLQNKVASDWLIYYPERKQQHEERRTEIVAGTVREKASGPSTGLSKPTEVMAIKLAEHETSNDAKWLWTIETVYNMLGCKKQLLIRIRQECKFYSMHDRGRPSWIIPAQKELMKIGLDYSDDTLHEMWKNIRELVIRVAFLKDCKFY